MSLSPVLAELLDATFEEAQCFGLAIDLELVRILETSSQQVYDGGLRADELRGTEEEEERTRGD